MNDQYKDYKTRDDHAPKKKTNWQQLPTQTWFHFGIWNISKNVKEVILFIKVANYSYPRKKDNYQSVAYAQELQFSNLMFY